MLNISEIVNAAGAFTPVGVSRSSAAVAEAAAWALRRHLPIDILLHQVSSEMASFSGLPAGTVTHCTSASVVLSVAAAITGRNLDRVVRLPDTSGLACRVVLPGAHRVNFGHPIETDIRLAGGVPVIVGDHDDCTIEQMAGALKQPGIACLLLVSSHLTPTSDFDFNGACRLAAAHHVPVIVDAAAQDLRIKEIVAWEPTAVLCSAQKYLAAPTAGLIFGETDFIETVRLQDKGIGRPMKPSKEAIVGVLAALAERKCLDVAAFRVDQDRRSSG